MQEKISLKNAYATLARKLEIILQGQAPSAKIGRAIVVDYDEEGMYIRYSGYGTYLYRGTMDERSPKSINTGMEITGDLLDALADYAVDENPGRGIGGIRPRYFLNLNDITREMIAEELSVAYAEAINEVITQEINESFA